MFLCSCGIFWKYFEFNYIPKCPMLYSLFNRQPRSAQKQRIQDRPKGIAYNFAVFKQKDRDFI